MPEARAEEVPRTDQREVRTYLFPLLILLVTAFIYAPSVEYDFVFDDIQLIVDNPVVSDRGSYADTFAHHLGWRGGHSSGAFWRPVTLSYFKVLHDLFGPSPRAYHTVNVLLFALVALLLFGAVRTYLGAGWALFAALLFVVHPHRTESVAWMSGAGDLLCGLFLLLSARFFHDYLDRSGRAAYLLSLVAFAAAVLSKETAFLLPVYLLVAVCLHGRETARERLRPLVPFFAVTGALWTIRAFIVPDQPAMFGLGERLLTAPVLAARHMVQMTVPLDHVPGVSAIQPTSTLSDWRFGASLAFFLILAGFAAWAWRARTYRALLLPATWMILFLAPVCLIGFASVIYAERYSFIPGMGHAVLLAAGSKWLLGAVGTRRRLRARVALGALCLCLAGMTWVARSRVEVWRHAGALFTQILRQFPTSSDAAAGIARYLDETASDDRAIAWLEELVEAYSANSQFHYELGLRYAMANRLDDAQTSFERAVSMTPRHSASLNGLGNLAILRGDLVTAGGYYGRAVGEDANNAEALFNLGTVSRSLRRCQVAREAFTRFVAVATDELGAQRDEAQRHLREMDEAISSGQCR